MRGGRTRNLILSLLNVSCCSLFCSYYFMFNILFFYFFLLHTHSKQVCDSKVGRDPPVEKRWPTLLPISSVTNNPPPRRSGQVIVCEGIWTEGCHKEGIFFKVPWLVERSEWGNEISPCSHTPVHVHTQCMCVLVPYQNINVRLWRTSNSEQSGDVEAHYGIIRLNVFDICYTCWICYCMLKN